MNARIEQGVWDKLSTPGYGGSKWIMDKEQS